MKLSIVSGLNESKSNKIEVNKKFLNLCEFLKPLNYDGIELALLEPENIDARKINEIKESYQLEISALGTGSTYLRFGYSFGHQNDLIREKAIERIEEYIKFGQETQAIVIIGLIRGRFNYNSNQIKEKLNIITSLKKCCKIAENYGVYLTFEPINSFEIDSFNTITESVKLIEEIGSENLKLLIDSFHINLEEDPGFVWDDLREIVHLVNHIHIADCNRRAPGTGHFDFKTFLTIFKNKGYKGFASVETIMKPSFEEVAKQTSKYLGLIL
ncbi:MAG: sugar phosphate isomerase/epimerase family protein [Promethearchaeota archaeon]